MELDYNICMHAAAQVAQEWTCPMDDLLGLAIANPSDCQLKEGLGGTACRQQLIAFAALARCHASFEVQVTD